MQNTNKKMERKRSEEIEKRADEQELERKQTELDLIGILLVRPNELQDLIRSIKPELFKYCRRYIDAILKTYDKGENIDVKNVCLVGNLNGDEVIELTEITKDVSRLTNPSLLLGKLREYLQGDKIAELRLRLKAGERSTDDEVNDIRASLQEIESIGRANMPNKKELLSGFIEYCQKSDSERIQTPFNTLNKMLNGGLSLGGYTLLGGTPGSGKTSFMLEIGLNAAKQGKKVAFIEGEMEANEILERLGGIDTGKEINLFKKNYEQHIKPFNAEFYELPFEIIPLFDRNLDNLMKEVKYWANDGAKLIFIDYLQVFPPKRAYKDEFMEIRETSRRLRELALMHNVHIFVASSLNRSEANANKISPDKISLNSFYGSSGLGHDCSLGLILSGEQSEIDEFIKPERMVKLHVVKNRSGARGDITLKYYLRSQRFEEITREMILNQDKILEDYRDDKSPF
jgi:replicative DNA helicase